MCLLPSEVGACGQARLQLQGEDQSGVTNERAHDGMLHMEFVRDGHCKPRCIDHSGLGKVNVRD